MDDGNLLDGFGFFSLDEQAVQPSSPSPKDEEPEKKPRGRKHRQAEVYELTPKFEYRRAFSESSLLDALKAPGFHFQEGHAYNFITAGDIDSLSFLKAILRQQDLDYCLASTWCMGAEDILQFREWVEADRIKKLDIYVGEIFSGSYAVEFQMLKRLYEDHPEIGRYALFRNHSKVYAGVGRLYAFGIQSSANINTNPRTENTCVTIDRGLFDFYKQYYDGIKSFDQ